MVFIYHDPFDDIFMTFSRLRMQTLLVKSMTRVCALISLCCYFFLK